MKRRSLSLEYIGRARVLGEVIVGGVVIVARLLTIATHS